MKRSTNRILTTHAGRLTGSPELMEVTREIQSGRSSDYEGAIPLIRSSMADVIRHQVALGIDIVSDGELGKIGFGLSYYSRRLTGLNSRPVRPGEAPTMSAGTAERQEFAEFYASLNMGGGLAGATAPNRVIVDGPIKYIGQDEVKRDIELFKSSLAASGVTPEETFMCVLAPGWLEHFFYNEYYKTDEEYLFALAEAIGEEYRAVVDAGFILQLDDPGLPDTFDMIVPNPTIEEYRKFEQIRIDAQNHALRGIPEDRVRYHICWGSWHGPHTTDIPFKHLIDLMLKINAKYYTFEAANARHEHEWRLWKETKLPDGKVILPGVVTHSTNLIEHPELVADRIVNFAEAVGPDNVVASTDCGLGGRVHPLIAWAKLKTLSEGAALASKRLYRKAAA
jgi:5-methyltetrahydropteroyltriglutamate--homocysteine methyltransferase